MFGDNVHDYMTSQLKLFIKYWRKRKLLKVFINFYRKDPFRLEKKEVPEAFTALLWKYQPNYFYRLYVYGDRILTQKEFSSLPFTVTSLQFCLEFFYFFKLTQPLTTSTFQLLHTVKEKGEKPDRKPNPLPLDLRNPYKNLKSENTQDYAQKP